MNPHQFFSPYSILPPVQPHFTPPCPPVTQFTPACTPVYPPVHQTCFPVPVPLSAPSTSFTRITTSIPDTIDIESIITQKRTSFSSKTENQNGLPIQLFEISKLVKEFYGSLCTLKNLLEELKSCNTESKNDLDHLAERISSEQEKISNLRKLLSSKIANPEILKYKINKRRKKRRKKVKVLSLQARHQIANEHMQRSLKIATDIEQDKKLKRDADNILSDVLRKKNETVDCIQLLNALQKLHTARCHATGKVSLIENSGFNNVIEKLKTLWEKQLKEYQVEENGFRVMLKELADVNREEKINQHKNKIFGKWLKSIFGVSDLRTMLSYSNVDEFIQIRQGWDKYVVEDCDTSSKIPRGWILPEDKCDDSWKKFICK